MKEDREYALRRLARAVQEVRSELNGLQKEIAALCALDPRRELSVDERIRLRMLRQASERLRWQLQAYWQEFEELRDTPRVKGARQQRATEAE